VRRPLPVLLAVAACAAVVALPAAGHIYPWAIHRNTTTPWLSYGGNDGLTNAANTTIDSDGLGQLWQTSLDGPVYGSPLYDNGVVFVATENGTLYALDAATGNVRWRAALGATETLDDGCGTWGITSTPTIDLASNSLFAIGGDGLLHRLDLTTGAELPSYPVQLISRPSVEYVWGGLRILDGTLYVTVASYCDETSDVADTADGGVIAFNLTTQTSQRLDTVPGPGNLGGVWGYGGVSSDGTYLYAGVGNAYSPLGEDAGYGDHLIQFTPAPALEVVSANKPPQVSPSGDQDFGSAPVLFQPTGCPAYAAANNKSGYAFVWPTGNIAGGPVATLGLADAVTPFVGAPSWSASRQMLVFAEAKTDKTPGDEGVAAYHVNADCTLSEAWLTPTGTGVQTPPLLTTSLVFTGAGSGGIDALNIDTGAVVWHEATAEPASAPLIEGGGRVYAPVGDTIQAIGD